MCAAGAGCRCLRQSARAVALRAAAVAASLPVTRVAHCERLGARGRYIGPTAWCCWRCTCAVASSCWFRGTRTHWRLWCTACTIPLCGSKKRTRTHTHTQPYTAAGRNTTRHNTRSADEWSAEAGAGRSAHGPQRAGTWGRRLMVQQRSTCTCMRRGKARERASALAAMQWPMVAPS